MVGSILHAHEGVTGYRGAFRIEPSSPQTSESCTMGHLRIPSDTINLRSGVKPGRRPQEYLFTQSRWHAIHFICENEMVLERGEIDPMTVLPFYPQKHIIYGAKFGITAVGYEFVFGDGTERVAGAIVVVSGRVELGMYAVKAKGV